MPVFVPSASQRAAGAGQPRLAAPRPPRRDDERPISLWRAGLISSAADRFARVEAWTLWMFAALTLPAVAFSQARLWHLLGSDALDRLVRAALLPASVGL